MAPRQTNFFFFRLPVFGFFLPFFLTTIVGVEAVYWPAAAAEFCVMLYEPFAEVVVEAIGAPFRAIVNGRPDRHAAGPPELTEPE